MNFPVHVGIDIGGTSAKIALVRGAELLTTPVRISTGEAKPPGEVLHEIVQEIERLKQKHSFAAIGVGVAGHLDIDDGSVIDLTNLPLWKNFPIAGEISRQTGLPCATENDATAMALAEWKFGAGRGAKNLLCITLGTGIGGGLILNGELYHGSRFGAGEVGQMTLDWRGLPGSYGNFGALEEYAGNRQIAERAATRYAGEKKLEDCEPHKLAAAAEAGDAIAAEIWRETGRMIGAILADIQWLLDLDRIVIGGGIAKAGSLIFKPIEEAVAARTLHIYHERLEILPAAFGNDAGLIGAAAVAERPRV